MESSWLIALVVLSLVGACVFRRITGDWPTAARSPDLVPDYPAGILLWVIALLVIAGTGLWLFGTTL